MRKVSSLVMLILILVGMMAIVPGAAAFPSGTWVSGVTVRNLSTTSTAKITITFYYGDDTTDHDPGDQAYVLSDSIGAGSAKTWYIPDVSGVPDSFIGSAVVASDQPVAATVNTQVPTTGTGTTGNPNRVGTSSGVLDPTPNAYATQLMKAYSGWNSYCAVQNTGSTATDVTARYYDAGGTQVDTDTVNVAAYASYIFDQSTDDELSSGFSGSAKFEGGGQDLAIVCNFYNASTNHTTAQFHSYNGVGSGAEKLWIPRIVKDYYNYQSGLKIQNVGGSNVTVTVEYNFPGLSGCTQTSSSIGPGQSWGPYMGEESQLPACLAGVSGSGSATVTAPTGASIIGTVNEDNRVNPPGRGVTYNAFLDGEGKHTVIFPQITAKFYGYCSGWQVQLVEAGPATCRATYSAYGTTNEIQVDFTLPNEGDSYDEFAPNVTGMGQDYNGSVSVTCDKDIVGIGNLSYRYDVDPRYGQNYGDSFTTYNGILTD